IQELEDDILPSEAERRYQEYKSEYVTTQKRAYFNAHKDEAWYAIFPTAEILIDS
ncbi:serrate RNA effector molecule-like protein, partial [Trifolium medium]|nr:serrate RNA effector molecule-like protein [Trifolium medium]